MRASAMHGRVGVEAAGRRVTIKRKRGITKSARWIPFHGEWSIQYSSTSPAQSAEHTAALRRACGEERAVGSEGAGTTRDPVDSEFRYHGRDLVFVDTAGLRRKTRVKDSIEYYSALRTDRVIYSAHVCVLLVDASEDELHAQDVKIAEKAWEAGRGLVLIAN